MLQNMGTFDRIIRFIVGSILMALAYYYRDLPYSFLGWLGAIPLATSLFGYCPFYSIVGVRTDGKLTKQLFHYRFHTSTRLSLSGVRFDSSFVQRRTTCLTKQ
jgi:Protein of unknown function (DUF2892)